LAKKIAHFVLFFAVYPPVLAIASRNLPYLRALFDPAK
jgi:hypothetical protein